MIANRVSENQIALPDSIASRFEGVQSFDVTSDGQSITLRPQGKSLADESREHLERIGITEQDIADAIAWARSQE